MAANLEYEMFAANSIKAGDRITFADEVIFVVDRVEDAENDGVTFYYEEVNDPQSNAVVCVSMTFPKKSNIKRLV